MALDATVGSATANSYVTREEADLYFSNRAHSSLWYALDDAEKDKFLITATQQLEWYVKWKGTKTDPSQALHHPVKDVEIDGVLIPDDEIHINVKKATFEYAYSSIEEDRSIEDSLDGIEMLKLDVLQLKASTGSTRTTKQTVPDKIWAILTGLTLRGTAGVVRLIRA